MYHIAGKFANKDVAGVAFHALEQTMRTFNFRAHLTRLQLQGSYYVSVIHPDENAVTPAIAQAVTHELSHGDLCTLPDDVIATILKRVKARREQGGGEYISHTPTQVSYKTPALQDRETGEIVQSFPGQVEITGETPFREEQAQGKKSFDAIAGSSSPALPGLAPGTPLKVTRLPFIIGYRNLQARGIDSTPDKYGVQRSAQTDTLQATMNAIIARKLRRAEKYQFDQSAISMLETVRDPLAQEWLPLKNSLWVEFRQVLNTPHGADIRALWVHAMNVETDIRELAPPGREPRIYEGMTERNNMYRDYWSFNIITAQAREMFDFTYDVAQGRYIYLYSHVCPYGECSYPVPETLFSLGECSPCPQCRAALAHWASVLHTAIRIIRREYALAPQEPRPWAGEPESYTEQVPVKVGKGKNAHFIKQEKTREVDYRLVRFEVSELGYPARALGDDIVAQAEQDAQEKGKRANWLKLAQAGEPDTIVWEYREIDTSRGRTLDPEHNPRWKAYKHVEAL